MTDTPRFTDDRDYYPSTEYERGYADGREAAAGPRDEGLREAAIELLDAIDAGSRTLRAALAKASEPVAPMHNGPCKHPGQRCPYTVIP